MNAHRLTLAAAAGDDLRRFLGGIGAWDTVFLHHGGRRRRSVWHLALGLLWPRSADAVVPSLYRVVARIAVSHSIPEGERREHWRLVASQAMVLALDPRSLARRQVHEWERADFILDEIEAGSLPNRTDWLRRNQAPERRGQLQAEAYA